MTKRPHPPRGILCILAGAVLALAACPDDGPPAPTPLAAERTEPDRVALSSVEALVPRDLPGFEAWQVQRHDGSPKRVIVERFIRGQCYQRQSYARLDDSGYLLPEGPALQGVRAINPTVSQTAPPLLMTHALERDRLPHKDQVHVARHGRQQPAWSFARLPAPEGDDRIIEVTTTFGYEPGGCTMPVRLAPQDVPAPRIGDLPTTAVIDRRHATWVPIPGTDSGPWGSSSEINRPMRFGCPIMIRGMVTQADDAAAPDAEAASD